jgi:transposase
MRQAVGKNRLEFGWSIVFMDESPTKEGTARAWLWTAVAPTFAVFAICLSRAATAIGQLRAKMEWQAGRLQWCWAHLQRDVQALIDHPDRQVTRLGHDLMRQVTAMFQHWREYYAGAISRRAFRRRMAPVRAKVDGLLFRGACSGNARLVGMCNELYGHRDWLWEFVDQDHIQPTNNTAERALRHAVIWRKLCFGTQSGNGSRFVERALTVIETCRIQKRSVFAYVTEAVEAHMARRQSPSLLPAP